MLAARGPEVERFKAMTLWNLYPDYVHPTFAPNTWGEMHEKSCKMADNIIDVYELRRDQRADICLTFNFQRLKSCLERVSPGQTAVDILRGAETAMQRDLEEMRSAYLYQTATIKLHVSKRQTLR